VISLRRALALASALVAVPAVAASCADAPLPPPATPALPADPAAASSATPTAAVAVAPRRAPPAPRPPPPVVATAIAGDPSDGALAETHLATSSCEDFEKVAREQAKARLKEMHAEMAASFASFRQDRLECLRWRQYGPSLPAASPRMRSADSFGAGGGLGSIGGIGGGQGAAAKPSGSVSLGSASTSVQGGAARAPAAAKQASGTNNQVVGVDEADLVKTDGRYVYFAANGALRIAEAMSPRVVSVTPLGGAVREMFLEGDRAVVYVAQGGTKRPRCTYGYDCAFAGDGSSTRVVVLDVTNREAPRAVRTIDLTGSLLAARRIGQAIHTVVSDADPPEAAYATWPPDVDSCETPIPVAAVKWKKLEAENTEIILKKTWFPTIVDHGKEQPMCAGLLKDAMGDGQAFTSVVSFDLRDDAAPAKTATVQSRPGAVFAARDALYLSVVERKRKDPRARWYSFWPTVDEASAIHAFRIGERAADTRYTGSGVVPGHVLNQFAMDSWGGVLRVATTRGRVPDPKVSSSLSILAPTPGGDLVRVGAVDGLAPGEDIRAVRFDDDRGYVVTFKKTDPLFVLDLYDPKHPAVLGELKIPGFSTYMHRLDPEHLLSIGFDADDHGSFAYFDGVILQLFDVAKPTDPKLLFKEKIGSRGSSSAAATDHLAFNYVPDRGLLALPMTICEGGGDGRFGGEMTFSGLLVYDVDVDKGFTRLGGIEHGRKGVSCNTWWSNATSLVKRSVVLDDLVWSIADDHAKVQRLGHFGEDVADLALR
jgi:hypothetical protein